MRTLRNPSGWKRKIFLLFTSATSDFEKKHLHRFFFSSLSLAQSPYFHNYFHNFLAYFALRNGKKRWKKKGSSSAAGRAGSTFPLKRPLNHNLFGPSFHCISLKMIHALFATENFLVRLWKFSRIRVENGNQMRIWAKFSQKFSNFCIVQFYSNFLWKRKHAQNSRIFLKFVFNLP